MAGVAQHSNYLEDPLGRLQRTAALRDHGDLRDTEEAEAAGGRSSGASTCYVHGTDLVMGKTYAASNWRR